MKPSLYIGVIVVGLNALASICIAQADASAVLDAGYPHDAEAALQLTDAFSGLPPSDAALLDSPLAVPEDLETPDLTSDSETENDPLNTRLDASALDASSGSVAVLHDPTDASTLPTPTTVEQEAAGAGGSSPAHVAESAPGSDGAHESPAGENTDAPISSTPTSTGVQFVEDILPALPRADQGSTGSLAIAFLILAFIVFVQRRFRGRLPNTGLVPFAVSALEFLVHVLLFVIGLMIVSRFVPGWLNPTLRWVLLAAAAALGWSVRDLLPDLIGGVVVYLERRIKPNVWISGPGYSGIVETKGLRALWVRDAHGHLLSIPYRNLLSQPTQTDDGIGIGHEVILRLSTEAPSAAVRQAVNDAILASPWVPPSVQPQVLRDASDPDCWRVRCRLLEPSHALHFEGELIERVEDILAHAPKAMEQSRAGAAEATEASEEASGSLATGVAPLG